MQEKLNEVLSDTGKQTKYAENTLGGLRQKLSELKKEYLGMEIGSEIAKQTEKEIIAITNQISSLEQNIGVYTRNVGNYKNSFMSAFSEMQKGPVGVINGLRAMGKEVEGLKAKFGSFKGVLVGVGQSIAGVGKELLALIANPIGATIAAIAAAFMMLQKGISETEENTNRFNGIMAKLQPILDLVDRLIQEFAEAFLDVAEPLMNIIEKTGVLNVILGAMQLAFEVVIKPLKAFGMAIKGISDIIDPLLTKWKAFVDSVANTQLGKAFGLDELVQLSKLEDDWQRGKHNMQKMNVKQLRKMQNSKRMHLI